MSTTTLKSSYFQRDVSEKNDSWIGYGQTFLEYRPVRANWREYGNLALLVRKKTGPPFGSRDRVSCEVPKKPMSLKSSYFQRDVREKNNPLIG